MVQTAFLHRLIDRIAANLSSAGPAVLTVVLDAAIKGVFILALVALATLAMRRASAAARHWVWFLGTLSLLALPILSLTLPGWHILPSWTATKPTRASDPQASAAIVDSISDSAPTAVTPALHADAARANMADSIPSSTEPAAAPLLSPRAMPLPIQHRFTWQAWILLAWLVGSAVLLAYVALGLLSLAWLRRRSARITAGRGSILLREVAEQLGIRRPVELLSSSRRAMPMIWGLWRIRVLLPEESADWTPEACRVVLMHELAHARRFDCLTQLVAHLVCSLYWFNPLVWLARWRMQIERERACDDLVLTSGTKASAYAEQLLRIASQMPIARYGAAAIAMARPSTLEGRVVAILDTNRNRRRIAAVGAIAIAVAIGLCAVALATLRAEEKRENASLQAAAGWAAQHGWTPQLAKPILSAAEQEHKSALAIGAGEEADAQAISKLAQRINGRPLSEAPFSDRTTRAQLEAILKRRPDYFYVEFILALWHRQHGEIEQANRLLDAAYQHAPAILVQRYELEDGTPLPNTAIRSISLGCNMPPRRAGGPVRYAALGLYYPDLRTDADGCVYLPAYSTDYQMIQLSAPDGYAAANSLLQEAVAARSKVSVLPVATMMLLPGEFVASAKPSDPPVATAVLPDKNVVRILAISPYPNPKNLFWRPDGSPSPEHYETGDRPSVRPWPDDGRRLVFQFDKPLPPNADFQLRFSVPNSANSFPAGGNHPRTKFIVFEEFPALAKEVSIVLGVASGGWNAMASYDPQAKTTVGKLPSGFEVQTPTPWYSGTEIRIHTLDPDRELRVIAIDLEHHEHFESSSLFSRSAAVNPRTGAPDPESIKIEYGFEFEHLPPAGIASYRLESRRYRWVEFSNIALQPAAAKEASLLTPSELQPPAGFGRVVDVENRPVVGAALIDKGTNWSAICGQDGLFLLPSLKPSHQFVKFNLMVSGVGFAPRDGVELLFDPAGVLQEQSLIVDLAGRPTEGRGIIMLQRPGRVEGRVLGLDGKPLAKAPVELGVSNHFDGRTDNSGTAASATTDANGRFTFDNVLPGKLMFYVSGQVAAPPIKNIGGGARATLSDGQTLSDLVIDLSKSTAVATGRVVDNDSRPIPGAEVSFVWSLGSGSVRTAWPGSVAKTDNLGRYRLSRLPQGNWHVMAEVGGRTFDLLPVALSERPLAVADITLPLTRSASGRYRHVQPMDPGATVTEWIDAVRAGDTEAEQLLMASGSPIVHDVDRIAPLLSQFKYLANYSLPAAANVPTTVTTNSVDFGNGRHGPLTFNLVGQSGEWRIASVDGLVPPPTEKPRPPLTPSQVAPPDGFGRIVDVENRPIAGATLQGESTKWSAASGSDGLFPLPELQAGIGQSVSISVTATGFIRRGIELWRNTDGEIIPDHGVFKLLRAGRLEGRVLGPTGNPLAAAPISVHLINQFGSEANAAEGISDANGRFVIENVSPGNLLLYYPGEPAYHNWRPPIKGVGTALAVQLGDGRTLRDLVLDLSKSTGVATGRVVDKNKRPVAGADVSLQWKTTEGSTTVSGAISAKTDEHGRYRLENLPQGKWHIMANIGTANSELAPITLSNTPATVGDLVLPVVHTANGRIRRAQPMDQSDTVREWIDAMLAGDTEGARAVVVPQSSFARNSGRIAPLLPQINRFTSSSTSDAGSRATTNVLDLGNGRQGQLTFKMIRQSGELRISDVVDEAGKSLVAD